MLMSFSPRTSRLPFGRRSATLTVMLPMRLLLWLESALPSNARSPVKLLFRISLPLYVIGPPTMIGVPVSVFDFFAVDVLCSFWASVFSTSAIVRMSPTARARRSMNKSKLPAGLNTAPDAALL